MAGTVDGKTDKKEQGMAETVSDDYKTGGAYKAILKLFAAQLEDDEFAEHCRKFFKGKKE